MPSFRESHKVCTSVYLFRFNLPSPLHTSGLGVGQYISVRAVIAGADVVRYYSPISRPDAPGYIDLLIKVDAAGGAMSHHLNALRPGDTLEFKGPLGGISLDFSRAGSLGRVKKLGSVATRSDTAPAATGRQAELRDRARL
jgi:ferredoxin-NADP reductase